MSGEAKLQLTVIVAYVLASVVTAWPLGLALDEVRPLIAWSCFVGYWVFVLGFLTWWLVAS